NLFRLLGEFIIRGPGPVHIPVLPLVAPNKLVEHALGNLGIGMPKREFDHAAALWNKDTKICRDHASSRVDVGSSPVTGEDSFRRDEANSVKNRVAAREN